MKSKNFLNWGPIALFAILWSAVVSADSYRVNPNYEVQQQAVSVAQDARSLHQMATSEARYGRYMQPGALLAFHNLQEKAEFFLSLVTRSHDTYNLQRDFSLVVNAWQNAQSYLWSSQLGFEFQRLGEQIQRGINRLSVVLNQGQGGGNGQWEITLARRLATDIDMSARNLLEIARIEIGQNNRIERRDDRFPRNHDPRYRDSQIDEREALQSIRELVRDANSYRRELESYSRDLYSTRGAYNNLTQSYHQAANAVRRLRSSNYGVNRELSIIGSKINELARVYGGVRY